MNSQHNSEPENVLPEGWRMTEPLPQSEELKNLPILPANAENAGYFILNLAGYGLLGLFLFDFLNLMVVPRFTDPVWEFRVIGDLVEKIPVPLIGFVLVFMRRTGYIRKGELLALRVASWSALILGILYFLMIPLLVLNTKRINESNDAQITAQVTQQRQQLKQTKEQLQKATNKQIQDLITATYKERAPKIDNPQEIKDQLLVQANQAEQNIQQQADAARSSRKIDLIRNGVKWLLGAIIGGVIFTWIWRLTRWTRTAI